MKTIEAIKKPDFYPLEKKKKKTETDLPYFQNTSKL